MRLLRCTWVLSAAALLSLLSSPSLLRPVVALPPTAAFACGACEAIVDEASLSPTHRDREKWNGAALLI
jgi:hypothetical protein